jgi:hypothetical protein
VAADATARCCRALGAARARNTKIGVSRASPPHYFAGARSRATIAGVVLGAAALPQLVRT